MVHVEKEQYITAIICDIRTDLLLLHCFLPIKNDHHCDYVLQSNTLYIV
jgi:hypothetical protein